MMTKAIFLFDVLTRATCTEKRLMIDIQTLKDEYPNFEGKYVAFKR